jgi:holo-[acyl-carrier protein] synthase
MSNPTSVGIDLVDIERVRKMLAEYGERFLDHLLGDDEKRLLEPRHDREQFLAGRFAAKEAAIKALGKYLTRRPAFAALQMLPDKSGRPQLRLSDELRQQIPNVEAQVSISHERHYAVAIVILSEKA